MTDVNQKTELGELSRAWQERLKEIRLSMKSDQSGPARQVPQAEKIAQIPTDNELFAGPVNEELTAKDIFAGDEKFYKAIEIANSPAAVQPVVNVMPQQVVNPAPQPTVAVPVMQQQIPMQQPFGMQQQIQMQQPFGMQQTQTQHQFGMQQQMPIEPMHMMHYSEHRLSVFQICLITAILLVTAILVLEFYYPFNFSSQPQQQTVSTQVQPVERAVFEEKTEIPAEPQKEEMPQATVAKEALSLRMAQEQYLSEDYSKASEIYNKLLSNLSNSDDEELMKDFLKLQIALCTERLGDYNKATAEFKKVLFSNSPAVRVVASYHCGLLDLQREQYLSARTKAYQSIALIDAIDYDKEWANNLKKDCYFLAAHSLTKEVLVLCNENKTQPADLWPAYSAADELFMNLDESQVRELIQSGTNRLVQALLGPQVAGFEKDGQIGSYNIVCSGASVEELIAEFSNKTKIDSRWNIDNNDSSLRKQLVYLYLISCQPRQFATVAAGCAGLLGQIDEKGLLNVYNPSSYTLFSDHFAVLSDLAISQWREFNLRFPEDPRLATVHFALGLLYAPKNMYSEASAEYKLVGNRFGHSSLAPNSLYNLSKIKNNLKDYRGAYEDLKQLIEQFPDSEIATTALLSYAEAAGNANMIEESAKLYRKLFNLALTQETQYLAAFGAGKNSFLAQDYENAEKWLTKYTDLTASMPSNDLYMAYLYLAKTYLAQEKLDMACTAFCYAMRGVPFYLPKDEYIDVLPKIIDLYMKKDNFVQALSLLDNISNVAMTNEESIHLLLIQSKLLRSMGLYDKALAVFGDKLEYTFDPQLKAEIYYEMAMSYIAKKDLENASKLLSENIILTKPGEMMYQSALQLAQVCLDLERNDQAISVCRQLLDLEPTKEVKQKALELLASAYKRNQNYEGAALALLGQWK
jgi:tetratricopeptide (TPR) repeat protein